MEYSTRTLPLCGRRRRGHGTWLETAKDLGVVRQIGDTGIFIVARSPAAGKAVVLVAKCGERGIEGSIYVGEVETWSRGQGGSPTSKDSCLGWDVGKIHVCTT